MSKTTKTTKIKSNTKMAAKKVVDVKVPKTPKETVKCIDCDTEYDLFYDLSNIVEIDAEDGEEVEGIDIDNDRDPVRCILCRQFPRLADNETLQCEDCLETNKLFIWIGKYNDTIICKDCGGVE